MRPTLEAALSAASHALQAARQPLVYGLLDSTVEAQREAVQLARSLGAILDTPASASHAGAFRAYERLGLLTASLGEVTRADLVMFWACAPDDAGDIAARDGRTRVSVEIGDASGPPGCEVRLSLDPRQEVAALLALRAFIRGRRIEASVAHGLPLPALRELARRLTTCRYGIVLCDSDPPAERRDSEIADGLTALVRECHRKARVRLLGLRLGANAVGAENVLAWHTGFPASLRFGPDGPRYGPDEFAAEALLVRGDVDAALLVGVDVDAHLSVEARARLEQLPVVQLGGAERKSSLVFIGTAPLAATPGRVFRSDGVALRHVPGQASDLQTEADVLARLRSAL
jgi:formylmethanofuran dehydrogenase subunit B